jgi:hypothetical protein
MNWYTLYKKANDSKSVDAVAKSNGYTIGPVYHGTVSGKNFNQFIGMWNYRFVAEKGTSYFSDNEEIASGYGSRVMQVYLRLENPLIVDANNKHWTTVSPSALVKAKKEGNDGVVFHNIMDVPAGVSEQSSDLHVSFTDDYVGQIKLADPTTYDDNGIEIPLSERFNPSNSDIRY